ncbi:MAG: hypothetical protein GC139_07885 [Sideroxydans sp.]|nr:hypothetical protein [Sideroxydans sp.]
MRRILLPVLLLPLLLAACAGNATHGVNAEPEEVPRVGIVESVTAIDLPNEGGSAGAVIGGTAGAVGGSNAGGGRGTYATTILGGVLGSMAGDALQNSGSHPGVEIWVKLDDGKSTVVRQSLDKNDIFQVGDRVRIVRSKGEPRAEHLPADSTRP